MSTEPVCPGQCAPPRVHGKPKASSLTLKWGWPETDGGATVTQFEISMTTPDNETRVVYRGNNTECVVASLRPGRPYLFQVLYVAAFFCCSFDHLTIGDMVAGSTAISKKTFTDL